MNSAPGMNEWFVEAFRSEYLDLYPHRDREDAARAVAFLKGLSSDKSLSAQFDSGAFVLDCACGAGRHLEVLREAGFHAVGIDLSADLLRRALENGAGAAQTPMPVARADMRRLPFPNTAFATVLSLFTSFGYFEDHDDDRRVIFEIARVLRPGGLFLLDFLNAAAVRANLVPRSERSLPDGGRLIEERHIDSRSNHVIKRARREWPAGRRREWTESVHLYEAAEIEAMMRAAALTPLRRYGDFDHSLHAPSSPRLIVVAQASRGAS